jgi:hypothetical protein
VTTNVDVGEVVDQVFLLTFELGQEVPNSIWGELSISSGEERGHIAPFSSS